MTTHSEALRERIVKRMYEQSHMGDWNRLLPSVREHWRESAREILALLKDEPAEAEGEDKREPLFREMTTGGFEPRCTCGWRGHPNMTKTKARQEWREHVCLRTQEAEPVAWVSSQDLERLSDDAFYDHATLWGYEPYLGPQARAVPLFASPTPTPDSPAETEALYEVRYDGPLDLPAVATKRPVSLEEANNIASVLTASYAPLGQGRCTVHPVSRDTEGDEG